MTVDPKVYELARVWLANGGLTTYLADIQTLAERFQDCAEDYDKELEERLER